MTIVRVTLVILAALVIQVSLVADMHLFSATGDVMLLLGIAAGLAGGPERGAIVGFASGIAFDLLLHSPFGLSALVYCLVGYAVGSFQTTVLRSSRWIPVVCAAVASAAGILLFAVIGEVMGQESYVSDELVQIVLVVVVLNSLLALPAVRVMRWALEGGLASRVAFR
jgi:rod shape-determining protein MreD